jgi:hypothetical protein
MTRRLVKLKRKAKKKRMKDLIKSRIIDVALAGGYLRYVHGSEYSAIYGHTSDLADQPQLFRFYRNEAVYDTPIINPLSLQQALELVERHWNNRTEAPAL